MRVALQTRDRRARDEISEREAADPFAVDALPVTGPSTSPESVAVDEPETPRIGRNLKALAGGQVVTWTMTLLWTLVVPRALGPAGLGTVVSAVSVSGVLGLMLGIGTRNYLVREMVVDPARSPKLIGTAFLVRLALAPLVGLAAIVFADIAHKSTEARVVLYLACGMTVFMLLAETMQAGFIAVERMKYLAYADVINKTAQSLVGIGLVLLGFRAVGIMADMAAAAGVVVLLNAFWLRKFIRIDFKTNRSQISEMATQSLAYWASGMFSQVYLWIDAVMLSLMTRSRVVGWYGATTTLFQTLLFVPVLVGTAWLPRLVTAYGEGRDTFFATARRPLEFVMIISIPVAAGTAIAADVMIHVSYGTAYGHAVPVMIILAACLPPMYMNMMLNQVLIAMKRQVVWTFVMIGAAIVNPLFNLVLIPWAQHHYHNGAIGAAASLVLTELLMDGFGLIIVGRQILARRSLVRLALIVIASAGMVVVDIFARPIGALPALALSGLTLVALIVVLRIANADEVAMLKSGLTRLRNRRVARRAA